MEQLGGEIEGFSELNIFFPLCEYVVIYLRIISTVAVRTHSGEDLRGELRALPLLLRRESFT